MFVVGRARLYIPTKDRDQQPIPSGSRAHDESGQLNRHGTGKRAGNCKRKSSESMTLRNRTLPNLMSIYTFQELKSLCTYTNKEERRDDSLEDSRDGRKPACMPWCSRFGSRRVELETIARSSVTKNIFFFEIRNLHIYRPVLKSVNNTPSGI